MNTLTQHGTSKRTLGLVQLSLFSGIVVIMAFTLSSAIYL